MTFTQLPSLTNTPTLADIRATHSAIEPLIHRTPVLTNTHLNERSGAELYFKCENFQKIGAFKMRGGASAALRLSPEDLAKGLATHSSGNHAQAVARAAQVLGIPAYIVMPDVSPKAKVAATRGYGAQVTFCQNSQEAREQTLAGVVANTGANFIHPYDDYHVIAGQATCALELLEDTSNLDAIIAPVGGGGLMSGTALITKYLYPEMKVYGAEPEIVNDAYRSFKSGTLHRNTRNDTIADGLRTNVSEKTFGIIQEKVDDIFLVTESEIIAALRLVWERMKIIIEPSCAVPVAAILKRPEVFKGKRVGVIITGGNVDVEKLPF